ncbi:MAG: metallophosphoesterase [Planctomycetes bacterium]|nr:metallophosphoesterase [Planctomycetota bacterium]
MIVKPISRLIQELDARSFTVIGCPGADGQGPEALEVFGQALTGARGDFIIVPGDVAPVGGDPYYSAIAAFINRTTDKPVHVLPGGLDGPGFEKHFGFGNRAILAEDFALILLDNSGRAFSDGTLAFLRDTLAIVDSRTIIVAFHLPPPNRFTGDSLTDREWRRFEEAVGVWRKRITLLLCGHVRGYFIDEVDGLRLVVTGGGGSRLRRLPRLRRPPAHALEFQVGEDGLPRVTLRVLSPQPGREMEAGVLAGIEEAFAAACRAQVLERLAAEDAAASGLPHLSRLHWALAESRLRGARFLNRLLRRTDDAAVRLVAGRHAGGCLSGRNADDLVTAAEMSDAVLAAQVMDRTRTAAGVNDRLVERAVEQALAGTDIAPSRYGVCDSCGHLYAGSTLPERCAACGAPGDLIFETGP